MGWFRREGGDVFFFNFQPTPANQPSVGRNELSLWGFFSDGSQLARERFCKEYNRVDWWRRKKCPFQWTSEGECILMFRSEQKKEAKKVPTVSGRLPMLAHWPICPVGNAGKPTNSSAADLVHTNMQVSLAKNASEAKDFVSPKNCQSLSMGEYFSSRSTEHWALDKIENGTAQRFSITICELPLS